MDIQSRFELIKRNTAEILTEEDLIQRLKTKDKLKHYIGFEVSGLVHLGIGLSTGFKISDFQRAGVDCSIYEATWHAWANNKFGGNLEKIRAACDYFTQAMKVSVDSCGGDSSKVKFVKGDELYHNNDEYWLKVLSVSRNISLARDLRAITIMGRTHTENTSVAQLIYPPMQVADLFIMDVDIAHAGMDQRKAHVIAREVARAVGEEKPIAVHHPLLMGLQKPDFEPGMLSKKEIALLASKAKMSKSVEGSAIFIHDSEEEIRKKMGDAYCIAKNIDYNPVLNWIRNLVFRDEKNVFEIIRPSKFGGNISYENYANLEQDFADGKIHPLDLKNSMAGWLMGFLKPVRKYFEKDKNNKLIEMIKEFKKQN